MPRWNNIAVITHDKAFNITIDPIIDKDADFSSKTRAIFTQMCGDGGAVSGGDCTAQSRAAPAAPGLLKRALSPPKDSMRLGVGWLIRDALTILSLMM